MNAPRRTLFCAEMPREEAAAYLEELARSVDGAAVTLRAGEESVTLTLPRIVRLSLACKDAAGTYRLAVTVEATPVAEAASEDHLIF